MILGVFEQLCNLVINISGFIREVPGHMVLSLHQYCLLDVNTDRISTSYRNEKAKCS